MNSDAGYRGGLVGDARRHRRAGRRPTRVLRIATVLVLATAILGVRLPPGFAAEASPQAAAAAPPPVEEWLNQPVRLRETVTATSLPASGATPLGEIRAGAEVKAIGLVAGKRWVQIELPDGSRAYVPRGAIEYEDSAARPPAAVPPGAMSPSKQPTVFSPAPSFPPTPAPAPPAAGGTTMPTPAAAPGVIRGKVSRVPNSATLVVGGQRVRLSGIDPGPVAVLGPFANWVAAQADIACEPDAQTGRYRCTTASGVDVAEAAILNGTGRVGDGASPEYRTSETQAREAKRGLWAAEP
jgi:endonuclease YncB( thermonuclease family)